MSDSTEAVDAGEASAAALPLHDRVALSLGRMMMRFSALESVTRWVLFWMLDVHDDEDEAQARLRAMLGGLPFRKLREGVVAAARDHFGEGPALQDLRAIMSKAGKIEERRNVLTHSSWVYSDLPDAMAREKHHVSSAGVVRTDAEAFRDVAALDAFVAEIDAATDSLSTWHLQYYLGVRPQRLT